MADYAKNRQNARRRDFKKKLEGEDARRKREENATRIRKDKRIESFQKRRREALAPEENAQFGNVSERLQELDVLVANIRSGDLTKQLDATSKFRKLLSIENNPPIQDVIEAGIVPTLVEFLRRNDCPQLQFEASWALTNIASGSSEQTQFVLDSGAVLYFKELLLSPNDDVREQAVWALGNIAGDSPRCRDHVLGMRVMEPLMLNLQESTKLSMLRNATWTLSNFCRGKPQPPWEYVHQALPALAHLLAGSDEEVLTDACWALSYLTDGPNERIQAVIDAGVSRRVVELLLHQSFSVQTPALRTIGNIVTGDDTQTQVMLNHTVLQCLAILLNSPKKGIRKEACWTISNITAGNRSQIQAVIEANLIPRLVSLLKNADFDIKKEAAWALSNATTGGSPEQIQHMVEQNIILPFCDLLTCNDPKLILVALEGLENILKTGEKMADDGGTNDYAVMIEECGGLDKIEHLQNHTNNDVYEKAISILEAYFNAEEDENIQPNVNSGATAFSFGTGPVPLAFNF